MISSFLFKCLNKVTKVTIKPVKSSKNHQILRSTHEITNRRTFDRQIKTKLSMICQQLRS